MNQDWGKDTSDSKQRPFSGEAVQAFIKRQFGTKVGYMIYDQTSNKHLCFSDENDKDLYLSDRIEYADKLIYSFDAPLPYKVTIQMISSSYVAISSDKSDNYIEFDFDVVDDSGGSTGDSITATFILNKDDSEERLLEYTRMQEWRKWAGELSKKIQSLLNE